MDAHGLELVGPPFIRVIWEARWLAVGALEGAATLVRERKPLFPPLHWVMGG